MSLQTKIWLAVSGIVLFFSVFIFLFFPFQNARSFENYYSKEANSMAVSVSNSLEIALNEQNFIGLEVIMGFVRKDPRLDFITIAQPDTVFYNDEEDSSSFRKNDNDSYKIEWNVFKSYPDSFNFHSNLINNGDIIIGSSRFSTDVMSGLVLVGFNKKDIQKNRDEMMTVSIIISVLIFIVGLFFSFFLSQSISRRVLDLRNAAFKVGEGDLSQRIQSEVNDEIGELTDAFNSMIEDLHDANIIVKEKTLALQSSNKVIEGINKDITDSIRYAERIQHAIIPSDAEIDNLFPDSFILFNPKDIVSGDFYWFKEVNGQILFCVGDCTGHGVPGAFMSLICNALLDECTNEKSITIGPQKILNDVRDGLMKMMSIKGLPVEEQQKEGMDAILLKWDKKSTIEVSAAYNSLLIVRNGEIIEIKADKQPVGIYLGKYKSFTKHQIDLEKGDVLYLMTDGYEDQFGGKKGKKFKKSKLKENLLRICDMPMKDQKEELIQTFNSWKGDQYQVDDVLIVGIRF